MADELSNVQANQGVNPLWPLGAAVVGGGATCYGLNKTGYSSSPYKTVEDLIKEKEDTFNGKKVNGDAQQKAIDKAQNTFKTTVEKYNADLTAYIEANKMGVEETPGFKKQVEELENKKKAALTKAEENLRKNNTGELTDDQKKVQDTLNNKIKNIEASKSKYIADRENSIKAFNAELQKPAVPYAYQEFGKTINAEGNAVEQLAQERKSFNTMVESIESHLKDKNFKKGSELTFIPDKGPDKGKVVKRVPQDAHELKLAKQFFEKQYQTKLDALFPTLKDAELRKALMTEGAEIAENLKTIGENTASRQAFIDAEIKKLEAAERIVNDKAEINRVVSDAASKAKPDSKIAKDFTEYTTRDFNKEISDIENTILKLDSKKDAKEIAKHRAKIADLRRMQANLEQSITGHYNTILQGDIASNTKEMNKQSLYKDILRREELELKGSKGSGLSGIGRRIGQWLGIPHPGLDAKDAKELQEIEQRLVDAKNVMGDTEYAKAEVTAKKTSIKSAEKEIQRLQNELNTLNKTVTDRATAQKEIRRINKEIETIAGKGAKVNAAGEIILADGKKFVPSTSFKLAAEVTAPVSDAYIEKLENTIAKLKANMPNATKLTEEEIVQLAKEQVEKDLSSEIKAVEVARRKLNKTAERTPEELTSEFVKTNGSKREAITKALNESKEELKPLFEKKWGNGKVAAAIAGGAVVAGLLGYLIAPKRNS